MHLRCVGKPCFSAIFTKCNFIYFQNFMFVSLDKALPNIGISLKKEFLKFSAEYAKYGLKC